MSATVTLKGNPIQLIGTPLRPGDTAPPSVVVTKDLEEKVIGIPNGKKQLVITVPSLDTSVCEKETKTFNEKVVTYPNVDVYVVSMDLPFAQKRFCDSFNIKNLVVASDFRYRDMEKWGVVIAEGGLKGCLARVVFIVDEKGKITYTQVVPEIGQEPDYDDVLKNL
ncbi:MAG: thiol peroxidase [Leptospiraceae bacterium]|nr:thiol peroxidase [Leptospiraceae bacterium]MDW7975707.1 thiol peroxidase [Leptospiraceae bacterium]